MHSSQTTSSGEGTLICDMGRTPISRREVEKWCEQATTTAAEPAEETLPAIALRQTVRSVSKAA